MGRSPFLPGLMQWTRKVLTLELWEGRGLCKCPRKKRVPLLLALHFWSLLPQLTCPTVLTAFPFLTSCLFLFLIVVRGHRNLEYLDPLNADLWSSVEHILPFPSLQLPFRHWPRAWACFLFLSQKPSPSTTQLLVGKLASFCELHLKKRDFLSPKPVTTRTCSCSLCCFSLTFTNSSPNLPSDSVFKFFY